MANSKNQIVYVPVLKWKLGEQSAVQPLSATQKASVLPIAELQDRPFDWAKDKYTKTWDKHIRDVVKATVKHWGNKHEIAFDQPLTSADELAESAGTVWEFLFAELWAANVQAIPVISSYAGSKEISALMAASTAAKRGRWVLRYVIDVDNPRQGSPDRGFNGSGATTHEFCCRLRGGQGPQCPASGDLVGDPTDRRR